MPVEATFARLARATRTVLAGNAASAVLGFVGFLVLARNLSPGEFARVALFLALLELTHMLMDSVIGSSTLLAAGRYLRSAPERADMAFKISAALRLALGIVLGAAAWACAAWLASAFLPGLGVWDVRLACLGMIAIALQTSCLCVLQARRQFGRMSFALISKNALRLAAIAALVATGTLSVTSALVAVIAATAAAALVSLLVTNLAFLRRQGWDRAVAAEILSSNKWLLLVVLAMLVGARMDLFLLARLSDAVETGRYAAAFQLASVVSVLNQSLLTVLFPEITAYTNPAQLRQYALRYAKLTPFALLALAAMVLAGPPAAELLLGENYAGIAPVFGLLLIVAGINLIANPVLMLLLPMRKTHVLAILNLGHLASRGGANLALIPLYGAAGAALGELVTKLVVTALGLGYLALRLFNRGLHGAKQGGAP